jgi:hypothetical protein
MLIFNIILQSNHRAKEVKNLARIKYVNTFWLHKYKTFKYTNLFMYLVLLKEVSAVKWLSVS